MTFSSMTNNSGRTSNTSGTLAPKGAFSVKKRILSACLVSHNLHNSVYVLMHTGLRPEEALVHFSETVMPTTREFHNAEKHIRCKGG